MSALRQLGSGPDEVDRDRLHELYAYPDPLPERGWVRANFVATADGSISGGDDRSGSISGTADKTVFSVLRSAADAVLVGAGTARTEGYRRIAPRELDADRRSASGRPAAPALVLVTASGDIGQVADDPPPGAGALVVLTCRAAGPDVLTSLRHTADAVHVTEAETVDVAAGLEWLAREHGLRRILCEGGPGLLAAVASVGRLDELCLTWAPLLVGTGVPLLASGSLPEALTLTPGHLLGTEDGWLIGRWSVTGRSG